MSEEEKTAHAGVFSMDDLRGKTPEELFNIVELLDEKLRSLHQTDAGELRQLDDTEQRAFDLGMQVRAEAMKMLDEHRKISEVFRTRPKAVEGAMFNLTRDHEDPYSNVRGLNASEARDRALRALASRQNTTHLKADQLDHVERQIRSDGDIARRILVTENEDYRTAWKKLVTNPHPILTQDEQHAVLAYEEYRAMAEGVTTAGGFGIPVKLAA